MDEKARINALFDKYVPRHGYLHADVKAGLYDAHARGDISGKDLQAMGQQLLKVAEQHKTSGDGRILDHIKDAQIRAGDQPTAKAALKELTRLLPYRPSRVRLPSINISGFAKNLAERWKSLGPKLVTAARKAEGLVVMEIPLDHLSASAREHALRVVNARTLNPVKRRQSFKAMDASLAELARMHKKGTLLNPAHASRYASRERYGTATSVTVGKDGNLNLLTETRKTTLGRVMGRQPFKTRRQPLRRVRR